MREIHKMSKISQIKENYLFLLLSLDASEHQLIFIFVSLSFYLWYILIH